MRKRERTNGVLLITIQGGKFYLARPDGRSVQVGIQLLGAKGAKHRMEPALPGFYPHPDLRAQKAVTKRR